MVTEFRNQDECPQCKNILWANDYCSNCNERYDD